MAVIDVERLLERVAVAVVAGTSADPQAGRT